MVLKTRYRHLARYKEIVNILTGHGLGFLIDQLGLQEILPGARQNREMGEGIRLSPAERLRHALQELGPAFIKLGQLLSTRPDLLPPEFIKELELLQDQVPSCPFARIGEILEQEFHAPWQEIYAYLDPQPLAAASIGQVHRGALKTGEMVVVKVQRPGVAQIVETDLDILFGIARFLEVRTAWGKFYKLVDLAEEFSRAMRQELDYTIEGRNADRFRSNFAGDATVRFPLVYWEYSSARVLTLEYVEAIKVTDLPALAKAGLDPSQIAARLANALFKQIYIDGFYHADPHPGNIGVLAGEKILFMDFGMVGRLDQQLKEKFVSLVLAIARRDLNGISGILFDLGIVPAKVNKQALRRELSRLFHRYYEIPMKELQVGEVLGELLRLAYRYQIRIPVEVTMLVKALVTLEGLLTHLDPEISIVDLAEPFAKSLLRERYSPQNLKKLFLEQVLELLAISRNIPRRLDSLMAMAEDGDLKLELEHKNLNKFAQRLNIISNRLAFSIIVAAVIIGTSLLASASGTSLLLRVPIAEIGFITSVIMGLWLLVSIIRSGRL